MNKENIDKYLNLLVPESAFFIHRSLDYEKEKHDFGFDKENWYESFYKIEKIDQDVLDFWKETLPLKDEDDELDHPKRNKFAPT